MASRIDDTGAKKNTINKLDLTAIVKETQLRVLAVCVRLKDPLSIRDVSMAAPALEREGERERKRKRERSTDQHKDRGTHRLRWSSLWFLSCF